MSIRPEMLRATLPKDLRSGDMVWRFYCDVKGVPDGRPSFYGMIKMIERFGSGHTLVTLDHHERVDLEPNDLMFIGPVLKEERKADFKTKVGIRPISLTINIKFDVGLGNGSEFEISDIGMKKLSASVVQAINRFVIEELRTFEPSMLELHVTMQQISQPSVIDVTERAGTGTAAQQ